MIFWELGTHDAMESVEFLEAVFDWDFEAPDGVLHVAGTSTEAGGINGGVFTLQKAKLPFLTIYILVDDIEAKAALVEQSGGLVIEPPHEIPGGAWICLFNDPSGVTLAMYQPPADSE